MKTIEEPFTEMLKMGAALLVAGVLMIILGIGVVYYQSSVIKSRVGSQVIFERDTATIVDYSLIRETYTLSNGKQMNVNLVKNLQE